MVKQKRNNPIPKNVKTTVCYGIGAFIAIAAVFGIVTYFVEKYGYSWSELW